MWSSSETALEASERLSDFNESSVLDRMEKQLKKGNIKINNIKNLDLSWAIKDISRNLKQYTNGEYILVFPFCSKKHEQKNGLIF